MCSGSALARDVLVNEPVDRGGADAQLVGHVLPRPRAGRLVDGGGPGPGQAGCFASGRDDDELREALQEAIGMYLSAAA